MQRTVRKTPSELQFYRQKCPVNERGQRRRARLVKADRKVKQITTHYNSGMQKSISEHTTHVKPLSGGVAAAEDPKNLISLIKT